MKKEDDDRPISPLRASYEHAANQLAAEDDLQLDTASSNSLGAPRTPNTAEKGQRITMKTVRRTIDAQYPADFHRLTKYPSISRTLVKVGKPKNALQTSSVDTRMFLSDIFTRRLAFLSSLGSILEKDNVSHLSSGPLGRYIKINQLRT